VTRVPGLEIDAAISPDGKLVAYAAGPLGAMRIYVKQVAGGRPVGLTEGLSGDHRFPRWSPDGTRISFESVRPDGGTDTYLIPALGVAPRPLTKPDMIQLAWSPNGEQIAYSTGEAIFVGPADPGEDRKVSDAYEPSSLSWSPDGKRIAYTSGNLAYLGGDLNAAPSSIMDRGRLRRRARRRHGRRTP
jgi:Tol biopolymer transport system component